MYMTVQIVMSKLTIPKLILKIYLSTSTLEHYCSIDCIKDLTQTITLSER